MKKRIFIAINLPEDIKNKLAYYQIKWQNLPARWIKKENLHITLLFLGALSDEEISETCKITKNIILQNKSFSIFLNKIIYVPSLYNKLDNEQVLEKPPKMIWAIGKKSEEFILLRNNLEHSFFNTNKVSFNQEKRIFSPHITLARIKAWEFKQIELEEREEVNQEINLSFNVSSIEIMESRLKRGGSEYTVLESVNLNRL